MASEEVAVSEKIIVRNYWVSLVFKNRQNV